MQHLLPVWRDDASCLHRMLTQLFQYNNIHTTCRYDVTLFKCSDDLELAYWLTLLYCGLSFLCFAATTCALVTLIYILTIHQTTSRLSFYVLCIIPSTFKVYIVYQATSPGDGKTSCKVWLTSVERLRCSNDVKTRNLLNFAGVSQTKEPISAVSGLKFTIL